MDCYWQVNNDIESWFPWSNKIANLPSGSHVRTTAWLHHLNSNETIQKKARWELHKDAAGHFEQILEVTTYNTASV